MSQIARDSLEKTLSKETEPVWRKFAGIIKGGPPDLSRKGFSRGPE
jgi:DNA-binding phage protein